MLADLFDRRSQLLTKHFMMGLGATGQCVGCSFATFGRLFFSGIYSTFTHSGLSEYAYYLFKTALHPRYYMRSGYTRVVWT